MPSDELFNTLGINFSGRRLQLSAADLLSPMASWHATASNLYSLGRTQEAKKWLIAGRSRYAIWIKAVLKSDVSETVGAKEVERWQEFIDREFRGILRKLDQRLEGEFPDLGPIRSSPAERAQPGG